MGYSIPDLRMHVGEGREEGAHYRRCNAVLWQVPARLTQFMVQAAAGCSLLKMHVFGSMLPLFSTLGDSYPS